MNYTIRVSFVTTLIHSFSITILVKPDKNDPL